MKLRIKIPSQQPRLLLDLAKRVHDKHQADGEGSLLKMLNWDDVRPIIEEALTAQQNAEWHRRKMLEAYQQRSLRLRPVVQILRDSRDILTGAHSKEMKVLGNWGFDVLNARNNPEAPEKGVVTL